MALNKPAIYKLLTIILILLLITAILHFTGVRESINLNALQQNIQQNLLFGIVLFTCAFALGNLILVPGWIFLVVAVLSFGQLFGGLLTYFAAVIGCVSTFLIVQYFGNNTLRELNSSLANRLLSQLDKKPIMIVAALRIIFQTVPALNYTLALSGVKFRDYLLGTIIGLPIPIAVYCLFFSLIADFLLVG